MRPTSQHAPHIPVLQPQQNKLTMHINRTLPHHSPNDTPEPNTFELHRRTANPTCVPPRPDEPSASQEDWPQTLVYHAPLPIQRMSRQTRQSTTLDTQPEPDCVEPHCVSDVQELLSSVGEAWANAARALQRRCNTLLTQIHYSVLASEEEREAYSRFQHDLVRFSRSASCRLPLPSVGAAIESFDACLARLADERYCGPIKIDHHPLAEFIARGGHTFPPPERQDLLEHHEHIKTLCKRYQERIDDLIGTEQELSAGEYAESFRAAVFLWQVGAKYREALREIQDWQHLLEESVHAA